MKTELFEYQKEAVEKLQKKHFCCLFMEMGTGKTRTALELVKRWHPEKVIWLCPASLKESLREEILKHEELDVNIFKKPKDAYLTISGIEGISQSDRTYLQLNNSITNDTMMIVDESSYIKNPKAKRTYRIIEMSRKCRYRIILTGTPVSQGIQDLYSQLKFVHTDILGYQSYFAFEASHIKYSDKFPGLIVATYGEDFIAERIAPYSYECRKEDCLDLPAKMYSTKYLTKTEQQWSYSEYVKEKCFENIEKYGLESYAIFKMYNHLQQIVSGIYKEGMDNPRLDLLLDIVRETTGKVIIWCKYQKSIELIEKELIQEYGAESVVTFYGKTKKRFEVIQQFRKQTRFFVATSSVGGHGLTLNEAKTVIFYENTFKYSERKQAEDRCHRIGQTEKVQYIDLYCLESIDARIDDALSAKKNVSDLIKDKLKEIQDMPKEKQKELLKKWIKNI